GDPGLQDADHPGDVRDLPLLVACAQDHGADVFRPALGVLGRLEGPDLAGSPRAGVDEDAPFPAADVVAAGARGDLDPHLLVLVDQDAPAGHDDRSEAVLAVLAGSAPSTPGGVVVGVMEDDVVGAADDPLLLKPRLLSR